MTYWQREVDFSSYTEQYDRNEISVQEFAKIVAEKLKSIQKFKNKRINEKLEDIIFDFECLSEGSLNVWPESDFNNLLEKLYDWGDISLDNKFGGMKVCLIQM